jgi:hypothetical protein
VFGRLDILVEAFSNWALKMAEPRLIVIAVNAAPIRVPATPSPEVKSAAIAAATPDATTVLTLTTFCGFSSSCMMQEIVSA